MYVYTEMKIRKITFVTLFFAETSFYFQGL